MPGTEQEWDKLSNERAQAHRADNVLRTLSGGDRRVPRFDEVTKPEHYNSGGIECIEAIKASMAPEEFKGYLKGNTIKYLWRYSYKGKPAQDLKKAQWYLAKLLEAVDTKESPL